jgi:hypothetical protein
MISDDYSLPPAERKVEYLLLHLGVPIEQHPPSNKHVSSSKRAALHMGIRLQRISLDHERASRTTDRYMFRFPYFRRDDEAAVWIAESVIYAANITCHPFGDPHEPALVLPIPADMCKDIAKLAVPDLYDLEERRVPELRSVEYPGGSIGSITRMVDRCVSAAWRAAIALFDREDLHTSARFLKESQDEFYVWPGQYSAVLADDDAVPRTGWERTRLENGLLLAFKSVEALIGDPPKDDAKLKRKIKLFGIDPEETIGYPNQIRLHEFIRKFAKDRDTVAAHGSVKGTNIKVRDMFLYQDCARYMLVSAAERYLGTEVYS